MLSINNIAPDTSNFLQIVTTIAKTPKSLWFVGELPTKRLPTVAIVGTRRPSSYGQEVGYRLAYELAQRGVVIVSGLALGMDAIVHQAALDAGGITIAVMPGGLDSVHPRSHRNVAARIVTNGGALLSEYAPGSPIYKHHFIARNRIVSGISDGLLVIEASAKSGTMHTAGFALEQGRAVMAVPGNITSPASQGCNNLIKTGASAITSTEDVLQSIGWAELAGHKKLPLAANAAEQVLLQLMAGGLREGDDLQIQSTLEPAIFSQTLTMLEITGRVRPLGGNKWAIK